MDGDVEIGKMRIAAFIEKDIVWFEVSSAEFVMSREKADTSQKKAHRCMIRLSWRKARAEAIWAT
jgi:hypothetical protein